MLFKFFVTQWNYPSDKNEWTDQVRLDLEEFGFSAELTWIKIKSKSSFKKLVKTHARELALVQLNDKKETHKKMMNLSYLDLKMQEYLKDKSLSTLQAKLLFKFRTRMANFWENFKGGQPSKPCPVCKDEETSDSQLHSFCCKIVAKNLSVDGSYGDIFSSKVNITLARSIENIVKCREQYLEK